jgi:hypothetical protein
MGDKPLKYLRALKSLKIVRFANAPSRKWGRFVMDFLKSEDAKDVEEVYLTDLSIQDTFFEGLSNTTGHNSLKKLHLINCSVVSDEVQFTSLALSRFLYKLRHLSLVNFSPMDPKILVQVGSGQYDLDSFEFGNANTELPDENKIGILC